VLTRLGVMRSLLVSRAERIGDAIANQFEQRGFRELEGKVQNGDSDSGFAHLLGSRAADLRRLYHNLSPHGRQLGKQESKHGSAGEPRHRIAMQLVSELAADGEVIAQLCLVHAELRTGDRDFVD